MSAPEFTMRQLIEAGVHYGHQAHRWNPLMAEYIHSKRNGIHIIDLTRTVPMLDAALKIVSETVAGGGSILFVGTKRQAQEPIKEAARASAQFYINQRWLGGTLTNWKTVSNSIKRLNSIDEQLETGIEGLTKKELLGMRREQAKLHASLGGIREMRGLPSMLFVIDVNKEAIAIAEAAKLGIPVAAVVDSNCPPENIDYLIPGNDDASRAISLYCDLMSRAAISGLQQEIRERGMDLGETDEVIQQTDSAPSIESGNSKAERDSQADIAATQDTIPEQGPSASSEEPPQTATSQKDEAGENPVVEEENGTETPESVEPGETGSNGENTSPDDQT